MSVCSTCKSDLPDSCFYISARDGRLTQCISCRSETGKRQYRDNKNRILENMKKRRRDNYEVVALIARRAVLKRLYGTTPEIVAKMRREQEDCCACCKEPFTKTPDVDHIHGTNPVIVRGLLCRPCNRGLGLFRDSLSRLEMAVEYLRIHQIK